jgi:hypothetical protein
MVLLASLTSVPSGEGQLLPRWFGPKSTEKTAPGKSSQPDSHRIAEVNVEVAWLADPVTFPYYLEAHATGAQLEVRGYVPNKAVREQALRIAQVYSTLQVSDSMKEHPSLLVRPSAMSPQQLQSSVMSALRVALPKQHQQLKAECSGDGTVYVAGGVNTYEEKLAVSHALRRLHGCTSVQNLTSAPSDLGQEPPGEGMPIVKTSNTTEKNAKPVVAVENKGKSWWWPFSKASATTKEEPPLLEAGKQEVKGPAIIEEKNSQLPDGAVLIPSVPEPKKVEAKVVKGKQPLTAADLQNRIQSACPQVKKVEVQFTSAQDVRITLELATENEFKSTAERVFALPELQNYRPELQFTIRAP